MKKLLMITGITLTLAGCVTPKVMVSNAYLGEGKVASKLMQIDDPNEGTYKFYMRVCDLGKAGATSNCRNTEIGHNANK